MMELNDVQISALMAMSSREGSMLGKGMGFSIRTVRVLEREGLCTVESWFCEGVGERSETTWVAKLTDAGRDYLARLAGTVEDEPATTESTQISPEVQNGDGEAFLCPFEAQAFLNQSEEWTRVSMADTAMEAAEGIRDVLEHHFRYDELAEHCKDLANGAVLTTESGIHFRVVDVRPLFSASLYVGTYDETGSLFRRFPMRDVDDAEIFAIQWRAQYPTMKAIVTEGEPADCLAE
ncbi:hypothetical protein [Streptomyces decoyicus]